MSTEQKSGSGGMMVVLLIIAVLVAVAIFQAIGSKGASPCGADCKCAGTKDARCVNAEGCTCAAAPASTNETPVVSEPPVIVNDVPSVDVEEDASAADDAAPAAPEGEEEPAATETEE